MKITLTIGSLLVNVSFDNDSLSLEVKPASVPNDVYNPQKTVIPVQVEEEPTLDEQLERLRFFNPHWVAKRLLLSAEALGGTQALDTFQERAADNLVHLGLFREIKGFAAPYRTFELTALGQKWLDNSAYEQELARQFTYTTWKQKTVE